MDAPQSVVEGKGESEYREKSSDLKEGLRSHDVNSNESESQSEVPLYLLRSFSRCISVNEALSFLLIAIFELKICPRISYAVVNLHPRAKRTAMIYELVYGDHSCEA